jgi:PLD-like domain
MADSAFNPKGIDAAIRRHIHSLRKPGVLAVRPGYEVTGDQLTGKQAIVATVGQKKGPANLARSALLPTRLGGYPVDVREASAYQRLRVNDPAAAQVAEAYGRPEEEEPEWPYDREMPSGKLFSDAKSEVGKKLTRSKRTEPATHAALNAHRAKTQKKNQLKYAPQNCPPLERTQLQNATVIAHVSPDAGFATLTSFLGSTKQSLIVGMYDFTSGPILQDFVNDLTGTKTLQMVLDNPAPNETRNQTDWQTVQELETKLGKRASIARALTGMDKFVSASMFPTAYHIKVIVQDGGTFWISSGNLNNSNQPDLSHPPHTEDRDWHLIVSDPALPKLFEAYLNYDYKMAAANQNPNPEEIEKAVEDARAKKKEYENPPQSAPAPPVKNPVAKKVLTKVNSYITPLLTPDLLPNGKPQYLAAIMSLIASAEVSISIQLQYIEASKGQGGEYEALLQAVADKASAGVTVRLIESKQYGEKWAEKMKSVGVDLTANISLQPNVHNKGFVIDHKIVVVSSQNFSPQGVQENRDAGVILEDERFAQYFEAVFDEDWKIAKPASMLPATKGSGKATTKGSAAKSGATKKAAKKVAKTASNKGAQKARRKK